MTLKLREIITGRLPMCAPPLIRSSNLTLIWVLLLNITLMYMYYKQGDNMAAIFNQICECVCALYSVSRRLHTYPYRLRLKPSPRIPLLHRESVTDDARGEHERRISASNPLPLVIDKTQDNIAVHSTGHHVLQGDRGDYEDYLVICPERHDDLRNAHHDRHTDGSAHRKNQLSKGWPSTTWLRAHR